jgi:hypothetical protein
VSKHSYKNLRELLKQSEVVIYVLDKGDPPDPLAGLGEGVLRELTSMSGGAAFVTNDFPLSVVTSTSSRVSLCAVLPYAIETGILWPVSHSSCYTKSSVI